MIRIMYAVIAANGKVKGSYRGAASLYDTVAKAKNQARDDGDSVVEVSIMMDREPLFIRRRVVK